MAFWTLLAALVGFPGAPLVTIRAVSAGVVMRNYPHKDPGKQHDDDLIEKTRDLFADPVPSIDVPRFIIIHRGLATAKGGGGKLPKDSKTDECGPPKLTLRPTALSSPIYRDQFDYEVLEDRRVIGRIYEDKHAIPQLRWFWSITVFVGYQPGVVTNGWTATLEEAKAQFLENWQRCGVPADNFP